MEQVDARDLEAALSELDTWTFELENETTVQKRIDWLDKRMEVIDSSTNLYRRAFRHFRVLCSRSRRLPSSCFLSKTQLRKEGDHPLHQTALSDVYIGWYDSLPVALKSLRIHGNDRRKVEKAFHDEVSTWRCLRHPNIVPFIGVSDILPSCLVSEWMEYGDIASFFRLRPNQNRAPYIQQIITGVSHIHSLDLVHGDLKATNILINSKVQACIADFGLTVVLNNTASASASAASGGTVRWMAPELLIADGSNPNSGRPTTASDVYALGLVMWELYSGRIPFDDIKVALGYKIILGTRPSKPCPPEDVGFDNAIWALIQRCWEQNPAKRPACASINDALSPARLSTKRTAEEKFVVSPVDGSAHKKARTGHRNGTSSELNVPPNGNPENAVDIQRRIDRLDQQLTFLDPSEDLFTGGLARLQALCHDGETCRLPSSCLLKGSVKVDQDPYSEGELCALYRGTYGSKLVVVKALKLDKRHHSSLSLELNIAVRKHLVHPNLVPFLGTCENFPLCLVSEWMSYGNVISFLGRNPWEARITLIKDVLSGLAFLHSHDIIHGNLKTSNVLIDRTRRARLSDTGHFVVMKYANETLIELPYRWLAPELIDPPGGDVQGPTCASDIYALGMVIWAIFNNRAPFGRLRDPAVVSAAIIRGDRPEYTEESKAWGLTDVLWLILDQCWGTYALNRPPCTSVIKVVDDIIGL